MSSGDDIFKEWDRWLEMIHEDVRGLLISRYIFRGVRNLILTNPKIKMRSSFYDWMGIAYSSQQLIGIRRQIDERRDSVSFVRLFKAVAAKPTVLSRERYVALYSGSGPLKEAANRHFDKFAGKGSSHVDAAKIQLDRRELVERSNGLREYTNRRLAHLNRSNSATIPTYPELDRCLDFMEDLLKKYLLLFRSDAYMNIVPVWQYDWQRIFDFRWREKHASIH